MSTKTTDLSKLAFGVKRGQVSPRFTVAELEAITNVMRYLHVDFSRIVEMAMQMAMADLKEPEARRAALAELQFRLTLEPATIQKNVRVAPALVDLLLNPLRQTMPELRPTTAIRWAVLKYLPRMQALPKQMHKEAPPLVPPQPLRPPSPASASVVEVPSGYYDPPRGKS